MSQAGTNFKPSWFELKDWFVLITTKEVVVTKDVGLVIVL
jgi:hypothetical protein